VTRTEKDLEKGTKLSSFEILTLTALRMFEREQVDVAVVEVGMGGRLDATNIIPDDAILVSALTAVDLDSLTINITWVIQLARSRWRKLQSQGKTDPLCWNSRTRLTLNKL
jgi:hypothetical protein